MIDSNKIAKFYDAYYYAHGCGRPYQRDEEWMHFFANIADHIVSEIQPVSVLDAGCGPAFLVEALRERGVEAFGIDISEYAIQNVHPEIQAYCWSGNIIEPLPQDYDLIVSIEVIEHIPQAEAEQAIKNLCQHSNDILFSSTPFDYKEVTHLNVQPPEYWGEIFAHQQFYRDIDFNAAFITPWAVRFRKRNEPLTRLVREYERKFFLLWKENIDLRNLAMEMRQDLATLDAEVHELHKQISEQVAEHQTGYRPKKWLQKLKNFLGR